MLQKIVFSITGYLVINIIILAHEAGHFLAARALGADVDVVSFGVGKAFFTKTLGNGITQARFCVFPIGGYCRIAGERDLRRGCESNEWTRISPGSIYRLRPAGRMVVYLAGSALNLALSFLLLLLFHSTPYLDNSQEARVVQMRPESELSENDFRTGDLILSLNGEEVKDFLDAFRILSESAKKNLNARAEIIRDGKKAIINAIPVISPDGSASFGVTKFEEPVIGRVENFSGEFNSGLRKGDRILSANGREVANSYDFLIATSALAQGDALEIAFERDGKVSLASFEPAFENGKPMFNFAFRNSTRWHPGKGLKESAAAASSDTLSFLKSTARALASVFSDISKLKDTFSGPARASQAVGQIADVGMSVSLYSALRTIIYIASMISASICLINLLPLPALDGSGVVVALAEIFCKEKLFKPRTYKAINSASQAFTFLLLAVIWVSDTLTTCSR